MGAFFAGFAGAMALPQSNANLAMGTNPLVLSFVVIVIGGLGSLRGAFVGAMLVGIISRWAIWQYPPAEIAAPFAIMAALLLVKPDELFGTWGEME
jgi:branched-chain amino acid transport system permease protein